MSIHISDILGNKWRILAPKIAKDIDMVHRGEGSHLGGSKFFDSIKKLSKAGVKKLGQFVRGETKFKPSDLAHYTKKGIDIANILLATNPETASAIPVTSAIGNIADKLGDELKKRGRGLSLAGGCSGTGKKKKKIPKWVIAFAAASTVTALSILAAVSAGKKPKQGKNETRNKFINYVEKNPSSEGQIREMVSETKGVWQNPGKAKPSKTKGEEYNTNPEGMGLHLSGTGKIRTLSDAPLKKSKFGTRLEVWNGTKMKTKGGLTKKDLMKNKNGKIVSKRQHAHGMKMYNAHKLKPKSKVQI